MISIKALLVFLMFGLSSCQPTTRSFNNPVDPNKDDKGSPSPATDKTSTSSTESSTSSCLLGTCNPPVGSVYDFANSFTITPSGCTGANEPHIFDNGSGLTIFILANCGQRNAVYFFNTAYNGTSPTNPASATLDCNSGTTGVMQYSVDQGSSGFLLIYKCNQTSGSYVAKTVTIASDGTVGTPTLYESTNSSYSYSVTWNSSAAAFGVTRYGQFQRYSSTGSQLGGPISLGTVNNGTIGAAIVSGGYWMIIAADPENNYSYCSKINSSGTLQCNQVQIGSGGYAFSEVYSFLNGASSLKVVDSYRGISDHSLSVSDCTATSDFNTLDPTNNIKDSTYIQSALALSSTIAAAAYKTTNSLIVTTYDINGSAIYSENSVAGYSTSLNSWEIKSIQNKIYVAYDKDGSGYVSYSTQAVPQ